MKRVSILLSLLVVCLFPTMQAQTAVPKPGPELKKLQVNLGHWRGVFEEQSGPRGPARKLSVEETCEMILGGLFMQDRITVTNPTRHSLWHSLWIVGYDPAKKNYPATYYSGDTGTIHSETFTVDGNT